MQIPPVGLEEELFLVDPETRQAVPRSAAVLALAPAEEGQPESDDLEAELFQHQLELHTAPRVRLGDLLEDVLEARSAARATAEQAGLLIAATGAMPTRGPEPQVTREDRYLDMAQRYGALVRPAGTCAMHVHVQIESEQDGVLAIDRLAPWLPVVLALTANSPFNEGRDTGYASWRWQVWSRWPSAGPTERFGTLERYREVGRRLIESGAARDPGMLYYDARLSVDNPTVEVRVSDVCTDPADGVLVAALVRALAVRAWSTGVEDGPVWRSELLRAAQWRASRFGLADRLLHPLTGEPTPAREVLASLVTEVGPQLEAAGDLGRVEEGVARVLRGTGATRQRAACERSGGSLEAVVDDVVART